MSDIVIPISLDSSAPPSPPLRGASRMVKCIQTMVGWRPCLWISPYTFQSEVKPGENGPCRRVAVLMDDGTEALPHNAQIAMWTVPDVLLKDNAPQIPVSW
jgi:hypothetical protein